MTFVAHKVTRTARAVTDPKVSVTKGGKIHFNSAATSMFAVEKGQFVRCYYDEETNRIALEFVTEKVKGETYTVQGSENGTFISCKSFIDTNGISVAKGLDVDEQMVNGTDMLVFTLPE